MLSMHVGIFMLHHKKFAEAARFKLKKAALALKAAGMEFALDSENFIITKKDFLSV